MAEPFRIDLTDDSDLASVDEGALAEGGLQVHEGAPPPLFAEVDVEVRLPGATTVLVRGHVVNHAPGPEGFFVTLDDGEELQRLRFAVARIRAGDGPSGDGAVPAPDDEAGSTGPPALEPLADPETLPDGATDLELETPSDAAGGHEAEDAAPDEVTGASENRTEQARQSSRRPGWNLLDPRSEVPLRKQIEQLTTNERIRVARTAQRPARRLLIRDAQPRVHLELVRNPKVGVDEIAEYTRMPHLSSRALRDVAATPKFLQRRDVLRNVVVHPRTPFETARRLMDRLNHAELRQIVRQSRTRAAIRNEAKRRLRRADER